MGGGLLRVYCQGQAQLFPHGDELVGVLRIADAGDGVLRPQLLGGETGEQVQLVPAGGGDEQVGLLHPRRPEGGHGGPVAGDRHHVQALGALAENQRVGVNDGDVVALGGELGGQSGPHLAVANDDDIHDLPPFALG